MTGAQDRKAKLVSALRAALGLAETGALLFNAEVKSVERQSCTVIVGDLELEDVRLKATINESANMLLLTPRVGSMVICGDMSGNLTDLCVLSLDEVDKLEYSQDGLEFMLDSKTGKVDIKNNQYSFSNMMEDLSSLLENFKVITPNGPSTVLEPSTLATLIEFKTKFKLLLK